MLRINSPVVSHRDESSTKSEISIVRANELLSEGNLIEAFPLLKTLVERQPNSLSLLTTTALTALQLRRQDEARIYLEKAVAAFPEDFDAGYNLALLHIMESRWTEALTQLRRLRTLRPDDSSLLNDMAVVWSNRARLDRALATYSRALRVNPNDSETRNNAMQFCIEQQVPRQALRLLTRQEKRGGLSTKSQAEVHRWREIVESAIGDDNSEPAIGTETVSQRSTPVLRGRKIAFFASQQTFLKGIIERLSGTNEVRTFEGGTFERMAELMRWADVSWFEWCDNFVIQATALPKTCRIICRLHSYEAFTDMPSKVDWSKVDHLVFVNNSVEQIFRQQVKAEIATSVVYNGVDLDRFTIPDSKQSSKRIASVGYINYKKNPALLLYCFKKIYEYDQEYSLHVAGTHQDARLQLYFQHFLNRHPLPIYFDGWVEDIPSWFEDKGYVISTSLFESFHYSIAEGMASGVLPLIHDWYGADNLYPRDYLFTDPDDCLRLLKQLEIRDATRLRQANRRHIAERFDEKSKIDEFSAIIESVIGQPATAVGSAPDSRMQGGTL